METLLRYVTQLLAQVEAEALTALSYRNLMNKAYRLSNLVPPKHRELALRRLLVPTEEVAHFDPPHGSHTVFDE
jgi:hypothetical protein